MQKKDQTFTKFSEFKALAEKESRKKIKALRSDNGGEYGKICCPCIFIDREDHVATVYFNRGARC